MVKSTIKEAIADWNLKNPTLRKKTLGSIAGELGITTSALSQIDARPQFQKHFSVVFESKVKFEQKTAFEIYRKIDIPVVKKMAKISDILGCEIFDLVKSV